MPRRSSTRLDELDDARSELAWSQALGDSRADVTDGQLLFEMYCARCHTQGLVDLRPGRTRRHRACSACPAAAAAGRRHRLQPARRRDRCAASVPATEPGTLGFDAQVEFITHRLGSEQAVRQRRHRLGPHARLRRDAHRRDDRRDRRLRAQRPRRHDVPRAVDDDDGCGVAARPRRPGAERMDLVTVLAQHGGGEKNLWDPTILGVLVALSAVGLFCGSVYLLLGTNLGAPARLPRRRARASTGFMVLLSSLWITTATPLNSPKGRPAGWEVKEVVDDPADASDRRACRTSPRTATPSTPRGSRSCGRRSTARSSTAAAGRRRGTASRAAVRRVRPQHRLPHRLRGLPDVHRRAAVPRTCSGTTPRYAVVEFCNTLAGRAGAPARRRRHRRATRSRPKRYVVMRVRLRVAAPTAVGLLLHVARAVRPVPARPALVRAGRTRTSKSETALRPVPTA